MKVMILSLGGSPKSPGVRVTRRPTIGGRLNDPSKVVKVHANTLTIPDIGTPAKGEVLTQETAEAYARGRRGGRNTPSPQ